jgi:predicted dehydrogenase
MPDLRIGVIGTGGRGFLAKYAHSPGNGSRISACCDVNPAVFEKARELYGSDLVTTQNYTELLSQNLDAVFVCSPDFLHEEHALAALNTGKHVYLEKPMAITIEGCDRILAAAQANGVKLYLGHNMRHFSVIQKMKDLIDAGAIGEVKTAWCRHFVSYGGDAYFKDWHSERKHTTGLLLQKGAHDIDILHWLCGGYTETVTAMGDLSVYHEVPDRRQSSDPGTPAWDIKFWPPLSQKKLSPSIDIEDISMALMRLDNGILASYQQCHFTPDAWRNYTVIGTEGRIENFGDGCGADTCVKLWNVRTDRFSPDADKTFPITSEEYGHGGSDPQIVAEFIRFIREDIPTATSPIAARQSVATGVMATQSLRNGSIPMNIPPLDPALAAYFK